MKKGRAGLERGRTRTLIYKGLFGYDGSSPIQMALILPFQKAIFIAETVAQRNGPIFCQTGPKCIIGELEYFLTCDNQFRVLCSALKSCFTRT